MKANVNMVTGGRGTTMFYSSTSREKSKTVIVLQKVESESNSVVESN